MLKRLKRATSSLIIISTNNMKYASSKYFKQAVNSNGLMFYSGTISFQNQSGYFVFEKYKELHSQSTF